MPSPSRQHQRQHDGCGRNEQRCGDQSKYLAPTKACPTSSGVKGEAFPAGSRVARGFSSVVLHGLKHGRANRSTPIICVEHR